MVSGDETFDSADGGWLRVDLSGASGRGYLQTAPAGDFEIQMSGVCFVTEDNADSMIGPWIVDTSGDGIGFAPFNDHAYVWNLTAYNFGSYGPGIWVSARRGSDGQKWWWALRKTGTNYDARVSRDGKNWSPWTATQAWAGTVDRIGFGAFYGTRTGRVLSIDRFNVV